MNEELDLLRDEYMEMYIVDLWDVAQSEYGISDPDMYERDELVDKMLVIEENNRWK